ncbi:MAG: ABC transporter substrate-binding protein [Bacillota bacterium]
MAFRRRRPAFVTFTFVPLTLALLTLALLGWVSVPGCTSWVGRLHPPAGNRAAPPSEGRTQPRTVPSQQPADTIRVWAYRWPAPIGGPEGDLAGIASRFESSHPGIKVEVTTFGYQSCGQAIARAIGLGDPPDVFLPPPGGLALYSRSLQIDLNSWLASEETSPYLQQAVDACSREGGLFALPRWVEGRAWICNPGLLLKAGIDPGRTHGWTWGGFEAACRALKAKGCLPAVIDPSSPETLSAFGYRPVSGPAGAQGAPAILSAPPAEFARFLVRQGLAESAILGNPDHSPVESFLRGGVGFLIGANPLMTGEVLGNRSAAQAPGKDPGEAPGEGTGRPQNGGFAPMLVPVPSSGVPESPLRAGGVIVFRQAKYRGDAHTRLAVDIAKAISAAAPDPGFPSLLVPAYHPNLGDWTAAHRWNAVVALSSVQRGVAQRLRTDLEANEAHSLEEKARRDLKRGFRQP